MMEEVLPCFFSFFSAYCWSPAKIWECHCKAVCQGFGMPLLPLSTNFLLRGLFLPQHTCIGPALVRIQSNNAVKMVSAPVARPV